MPVIEVKNLANEKVGELELADAVFAARVNEALLHEAVRQYLASRRAGTHKTKGRGEVSGSGRKLWRQKGTGRARVGSIRSPLWRHGGTVHGPQPRDYSYSIPRKKLLGALRSALAAKFQEQKLTVVEEFNLSAHKTRELRQILDRFDVSKTALLVDGRENVNLERSSRNLPGVTLLASHEVHPYDVLAHDRLLVSRAAILKLQKACMP